MAEQPNLAPRAKRPTGRRAGDSGTRDAILDAARDLFAARGYDGASVRAIATAAGVDPALIRHFFGDKDGLFAATMADRTVIPARIAEHLQGDPATAGNRIVDAYLRMWEEPETRPVLMALIRSATTSEQAVGMLFDVLGGRIREQSGITDPDGERMRRVALAGTQMLGVAVARYVIKLPPIAAMTHAELVEQIGPTIQRYLDGENI
ncbi:TetR/AcrR family transcriptional regulator [Agromyces seonyuensis]|uniref:TetR/AcrR family transcriptional regulator n=1 Tax=Agromyces seonyuensis TaxID=2662446 RepID=UPI0030141F76